MTRRLAVVAHFNATGRVADHVLRQLDVLVAGGHDVVVATTSPITGSDRAEVLSRARILQRRNVGQDFGSWHDVLASCDYGADYEDVLLTNDSYVSAIDDLGAVRDTMRARGADVWGMTRSARHGEHLQSYFLYFHRAAVTSAAFRFFWSSFEAAPDRRRTILQHEIGISRTMREAGFVLHSYLEPTHAERLLANARTVHFLETRRRIYPHRFPALHDLFDHANAADPAEADLSNWAASLADLVLDDRRLPLVKFDTLRFDPYWLDSARLLRACERRFPFEFDGVRRYLRDSAFAYPARPDENYKPARLPAGKPAWLAYRAR
ncbi:rhamnan synthesis F family protein [Microbacterium sp. 179-I 1D1 NHS]|uniref:rhamnan synthesis F family protein n=1 Tax=unclassified Microbacterium TaxID=2609290 RepID=UPI0038796C95